MSEFSEHMGAAMDSCVGVFGDFENAEFWPAAGGAFKVSGIFDATAEVVEDDGEVSVQTRRPVLAVSRAAFAAKGKELPENDDEVVVGGVRYRVTNAMDDETSEIRFVLMRVGNA